MLRTNPSLSRDFTLLSLFIVFILVLFSGWVTVETLRNYERETLKEMENEALRLDRGLIVELENASYILESVGRQIQATGSNPENIAQLYFSFAKSDGPKRSIFSWVNKAGLITVSNNLGVLDTPLDVADRDYVKKSIAEPWKVHIGRPIDGRLSHRWVLPLSLGITDKKGNYIGSAVVALDAALLADDVSRTMKRTGISFAITNQALTLLTRSQAAEEFFTRNFDINALAKADLASNKTEFYSTASLFQSHDMYTFIEQSSQYPYMIFLGLDVSESRHALRRMLLPRLIQLIVIAGFLLFVLWTVRRRIIQPVVGLTQETSRIITGNVFRLDAVAGPLEIEQLAKEIHHIGKYLRERKRVEEELRIKNNELLRIRHTAQLTNEVKADFFAYVGQELTDPVEMILAQSETIKDQHFGAIGNGKYLAPASNIHDHATQLHAMLEEIKTIAKAETGLLALREEEVNLGFLLKKTVRIFRDRSPNAVDVQLDVSSTLAPLKCDALRVKQMLLEMLDAAVPQLSPGDPIRLHAALKGDALLIVLSYPSNGAPSHLTRSKHRLNLALARLLAAMHEGTLDVKTNADRMTTMTVTLPAIRMV